MANNVGREGQNMHEEEFLSKIKQRAGLKDLDEARRDTEAVFETLRARISHEGGDNVAEQFPLELKRLWESGLLEHVAGSVTGFERYDLGAFLANVAQRLGVQDVREAEMITIAVFAALKDQITPGASHAIESQLPEDIRTFWKNAEPEVLSRQTGPPFEMEAPVLSGEELLPPAAERMNIAPPPEERADAEGPGSATHYRSDNQLTQEIEELLGSSDELDAERINVFVQAGNVTLKGHVKTPKERDTAAKTAARALGIGDIWNEIIVEHK